MRYFAGELFAESVGFDEHRMTGVRPLHGRAEQLGFRLHFAAALGGGAAQGFAQHRLVHAQLGAMRVAHSERSRRFGRRCT